MKKIDYLLLGVFILILYFSHTYFDLNSIMDIVKKSGRLAPVIFILIYTFTLLLMLPVLPLTIMSALIFGGFMGAFYNTIACTLGLIISFGITRSKISTSILKKIEKVKFFNVIKKGVNRNFMKTILITRCVPVFSYGIQNYIYGLVEVKFTPYLIISTIFTYIMNLFYTTGFSKIFENKKIEHSLLFLILFLSLIKGISYLYTEKSNNFKKEENL
ncbi:MULTISPECIES: TVP38/TMEM64 family protein [Psychrilyobacter]|uniref:TVP38/TMEM64 family membrane protein n=1 Tax=Psychrilyobacter piezotolerans TaxID=2293438 RepID=A0ABX9KFI6_9FUSO|nr:MULTISPECIES: VTT domain-containing protein [Psychrilyobacter]MCS5420822.1 VTT domain-containing protein [Psychrilyobacter sp. S5]RDE59777.1 TVP38/TMEM64 family protein [Psychrilyobacter sp. S5]REI40103.1 TVP38/TMEM64 family protein [Psychrilyobacter piezotolerans]